MTTEVVTKVRLQIYWIIWFFKSGIMTTIKANLKVITDLLDNWDLLDNLVF